MHPLRARHLRAIFGNRCQVYQPLPRVSDTRGGEWTMNPQSVEFTAKSLRAITARGLMKKIRTA